MKINYYLETDSLYIHLADKPSVDSQEISESVVADYDELGNLVGLDIDNASKKVQLGEFIINQIPPRPPESICILGRNEAAIPVFPFTSQK